MTYLENKGMTEYGYDQYLMHRLYYSVFGPYRSTLVATSGALQRKIVKSVENADECSDVVKLDSL